ncbi:MAG: LacI family DNA-binding transcriptional regulator [Caldilineaceae bacterium]
MSTKVRLVDIARACGVSPSTVSLVLRNKPGIPDDTRRRVLSAAQELGYWRAKSNAIESPVSQRPLRTVGLLIKADAGQAPAANPFYSHVLAGIEDACRAKHVNLLYATLPVDANNRVTAAPRLLDSDTVDGLLLVGAFLDAPLYRLLGSGSRPLVLVDAYAAVSGCDAVLSDNMRGAAEMVGYLLDHGHCNIGMVGGGEDAYPSLRERRQGYCDALRAAGVAMDYLADCTPNDAEEATRRLLLANPQLTALFCCNDHVALRAARAAQRLGRRIPGDLSLAGFDDIDFAAHLEPPLTTMHVDKIAMGRLAVQQLEARFAFPTNDQVTALLRPRLVERSSVATLPKS